MKRKSIVLGIVLATAMITVNIWSYWVFTQARDQALLASLDADQCRELAARIAALQAKPAVADTNERAIEELTKRIEAAATACGIAGDDHLASIEPEPPARVADTVYLEKPTTVHLRDVTLVQLLALVSRLSSPESGLRIKALRISAPPQKENGDLWSAEISITYLIYAPLQPLNLERAS